MTTFKPGDKVRRINSEQKGHWVQKAQENGVDPAGVFTVGENSEIGWFQLVEFPAWDSAYSPYFSLVTDEPAPVVLSPLHQVAIEMADAHVALRRADLASGIAYDAANVARLTWHEASRAYDAALMEAANDKV